MYDVPARLMNHACSPNTFIDELLQKAKRDISKGEELTTDYALEDTSVLGMSYSRGSVNCKREL